MEALTREPVRYQNTMVLLYARSSCSDCAGTGSDYDYGNMQFELVLLDGESGHRDGSVA